MSTAMQADVVSDDVRAGSSADEAEIRRMIADWARALEAKDVDGLVANYAPDALLFDVKPPYKTTGVAAIRRVWEDCLPYFPKSFRSEHRDLELTVGGDAAFFHGLHHMVPDDKDHPCGQSWLRVTGCFRKIDGRWRVVHEHVSFRSTARPGRSRRSSTRTPSSDDAAGGRGRVGVGVWMDPASIR